MGSRKRFVIRCFDRDPEGIAIAFKIKELIDKKLDGRSFAGQIRESGFIDKLTKRPNLFLVLLVNSASDNKSLNKRGRCRGVQQLA